MGSIKTYLCSLILFFLLSIISISAQARVQQLYGRSLMNGEKELTITRTVDLLITGKNLQPLVGAHVNIIGYDEEWETDAEGRVTLVLPKETALEEIEIEVHSRRYFLKNIYISFTEAYNITRSVHLKYNPKASCFRSIICPKF